MIQLDPQRRIQQQELRGTLEITSEARAEAQQRPKAQDDSIAESVQLTSQLVQAAKSAVDRVAAERVDELRDEVSGGTYEVDHEALADRIIDDALGGHE